MSVKNKILWSIIIAVVVGVYIVAYLNSPLGRFGIIWMTFISFPIYFNAGADKREYPNYFASNVLGVAWGVAFLWLIGVLSKAGLPVSFANGLGVCLATIACCALHFQFTQKMLANKVPAIFGGLAAVFSQGGENLLPITLTLLFGITLAVICQEATRFLKEAQGGGAAAPSAGQAES